MKNSYDRHIWLHALGAKTGGGLTYLNNILPVMARQLTGEKIRVVLLLPAPLDSIELPGFFDVRVLPEAARSSAARLYFDQITLPRKLKSKRNTVLFCSASFSPLFKPVPTVTLMRNAIYFDDAFLAREHPRRRRLWKSQGRLALAGARNCAALIYPGEAMRALVEAKRPQLAACGKVNPYGVSQMFLDEPAQKNEPTGATKLRQTRDSASQNLGEADEKYEFLYVMTYTLQKNLTYLLKALAQARSEKLPVRVVLTSKLEAGPPASFNTDWRIIRENRLLEEHYLKLAGTAHGKHLLELYRRADACVFSSICESFGHPLVEALALGKPLIVADKPYAREICGDAAIYIDVDKPASLLDVWRNWTTYAEHAPEIPRSRLAQKFSWDGHVERLLNTLLAAAEANR